MRHTLKKMIDTPAEVAGALLMLVGLALLTLDVGADIVRDRPPTPSWTLALLACAGAAVYIGTRAARVRVSKAGGIDIETVEGDDTP